jgi:small subunit ribosomal protein S16
VIYLGFSRVYLSLFNISEELSGMAVRIRLTRLGRKKHPFYRIVVADSERQRDGKFLDIVGTYDPMQNPADIKINAAKLEDWMGKGALPSTTVQSLIAKVAVAE